MAELVGSSVGRYEVRRLEGEGGMGEVYLAWDTRLHREVALKRLSPALHDDEEHRRRFLHEAERAACLTHQNVAGMHDVLEHNDEVFLVMEFVRGKSFDAFTGTNARIPVLLDLAIQIAEALEAAHGHHIVHRDVKPSNIRVTDTGQVKILDFGVARQLPGSPEDTWAAGDNTTSTGSVVGTPAYMAPEILAGLGADPRSDLFSLGVVLYQALTGRHPFLADTFASTLGRILNEPHTPPGEFNPRIPLDLERVVDKLLAKDPSQRYATAADVLVDLRRARSQFTPHTIVPPRPPPRPWLPWQHQLTYGAAAVVFVAILLLAIPTTREPITGWMNRVPLPPLKVVALVPLAATDEDPAHAALAVGLSEGLRENLARLSGEHDDLVATRAPSTALTGKSLLATAAEQGGANLLLGGTVEFHDRVYRVPLRVEGPDGLLLERIVEAPRDDVLVLEERLLAAVVDLLQIDWAEAEERDLLQRHDALNPAARAFLLRGHGYLVERDDRASVEQAIVQFENSIRLEPPGAAAEVGLGMARWTLLDLDDQTQDPQQAAAHCAAALRVDDQLASASACLGDIYRGRDLLDEAVEQYERAHMLEPTNDHALLALGQVYSDLGRFDHAERLFLNAIDRRPNDWRSYFDLGWMYAVDLGRHEESVAMFERARELAPRLTLIYANLGGEYAELLRWDDAIRTLQASLEIQESDEYVHNNLGTAYFNLRNWSAAAEHYGRAIELGYQESVIWGNLGDARYWSPGERAAAGAAYERALELAAEEPPDGLRSAKMAVWHAMLEHPEEATRLIREATESEGQHPAVLMKAARVCDQLGDPQGAIEWAAQALQAGYEIDKLLDDPVFDELRQHPQFQRLIASH